VLSLLCCALAPTSARAAETVIHLQADRIDFYYDRYLVEANGHVRVTISDGEYMTGDTFSMDLKLNRFLIASHVHLRSPGGNLDGAAISDFLTFRRIYFVPVITKPDRWTYENGNLTKPLKGRAMPGDVFYFPDLSHAHVSYSAKSAVISANQFVRFHDVRTLGQALPLPSFYVYFGSSQDLAQNSLSGANYDATWNATGNANSISAIHVRYDSYNHAYLSFEQHLAGTDPHEYAVFSVNPLTKEAKFWNLITGEHIGSKFQVNTFSQLYTFQSWLTQPSASAQTTYVSLIQAFPHSSLQSFFNTTNYNLLGYGAPAALNHPNFDTMTWTSFNNRIFKTPLYLQYSYGFGYNHDEFRPLQDYGGVEYTTIWNHLFGATFSLPNVKIGNPDKRYALYYLNADFNWQRQWYSVPHHVNSQNTTLSLSRQFSRLLNAYLTYNVANASDLYNQGGYAPYVPSVPGEPPDEAFSAFRGASTQRQTNLGLTYSASPDLVTSLVVTHHDDFPAAYPNLFTPPPLNAIGQYEYSNYLGWPPWEMTGEVRARILSHLVVDVQRGYFFHFGSQIWTPQFVVQFSQ
jgi:hypothetical protein